MSDLALNDLTRLATLAGYKGPQTVALIDGTSATLSLEEFIASRDYWAPHHDRNQLDWCLEALTPDQADELAMELVVQLDLPGERVQLLWFKLLTAEPALICRAILEVTKDD